MGQRREVNDAQRAVLNWIADGCPDGVMTGHTYKTTAAALQTRGLVHVAKKRGVWSATLTDEGRHFADNGTYPPRPATAGRTLKSASPPEPSRPSASPVKARSSQGTSKPVRPTLEAASTFLQQLIANGGTCTVPRDDTETLALVEAVRHHGLVPDDRLLTIDSNAVYGKRRITLSDKPQWMTVILDPIAVTGALRSPHPAVARLRDDKSRLPFHTPVRGRALRLLDALAKAAQVRGYEVTIPAADPRHRHSDLAISINNHPYGLRVTEQNDRTPHSPTQRELEEAARTWGRKPPKYDHHPSGRLTITVEYGEKVRRDAFADTKTIDLADRLPNVLHEVELRAEAAEERRRETERREAERRRVWETARAQAALSYAEDYRAKTLARQLSGWQRSRDLRAYLDAMRTHIDTLPAEEQEAARAWHTWATKHAQSLNPLTQPLGMPQVPEPHASDLQDFMPPGLSVFVPLRR